METLKNIFDKQGKKSLIISLLASVLFTFLLFPLSELLFEGLAWLSVNTYSGFIDSVYKQAAKYNNSEYLFSASRFLYFIVYLFVIFYGIMIFLEKIKNKVNTLIEEFNNQKKETLAFNNGDVYSETSMINPDLEKLKENKKILFYSKGSRVPLFIFLVFGILLAIFIQAQAIGVNQAYNTFYNKLTIVKPYIDEQTEEEILSSWKLIRSKSDYDKIEKVIIKIAKNNNITFPKD